MITKKIQITGHFDEMTFYKWIMHRSGILGMKVCIQLLETDRIEFQVTGHSVLLDAMEVACSLGPYDAIVEKIQSF